MDPAPVTTPVSAVDVLDERAALLAFLQRAAPLEWGAMLDAGIRFDVPEPGRHLSGRALAEWLARDEEGRIRRAALFHADARLTRHAVGAAAAQGDPDRFSPEDLPADCGMLMWAGAVSHSEEGSPVTAVNWEREGDRVRVRWWTDTDATAQRWLRQGQPSRTVRIWRSARGRLALERDRELPFLMDSRTDEFAFPSAFDNSMAEPSMREAVKTLTRATILTWRWIADGAVRCSTARPRPALAARLERAALSSSVTAAQGPPARKPATTTGPTAPNGNPVTTGGRYYPKPLPEDLKPWYTYLVDGGHSINVLLTSDLSDLGDVQPRRTEDFLVPVPVRTVLRIGWERRDDGFLVVDLPDDPEFGIVVPDTDNEH